MISPLTAGCAGAGCAVRVVRVQLWVRVVRVRVVRARAVRARVVRARAVRARVVRAGCAGAVVRAQDRFFLSQTPTSRNNQQPCCLGVLPKPNLRPWNQHVGLTGMAVQPRPTASKPARRTDDEFSIFHAETIIARTWMLI